MTSPLLEVRRLVTCFRTDDQVVKAVDDVSFRLSAGKTLGIVGESGCGKSVTSLSIMRLIQKPGWIDQGEILFKGQDLLKLSEEEMRHIRGNKISMIFQEPMTSLNPVYTCGEQIEETIRLHQPHLSREEQRKKAIDALRQVGIPAPEKRYHEYPHQLSGGMRQRVMIAMAMSCEPEILIADEPTTALDVTIQAQILDLMRKLQQEKSMGIILITHDLGVVAEMCDEVVVMYAGRVVEYGSVEQIFTQPKHPYTEGLLKSIPHFETGHRLQKLYTIPGMVPSLTALPAGCRFQDRCHKKQEVCATRYPPLESRGESQVACFFPN
ncbi:MAG: ABC transporter ATP-binding protein [Bdellovibrionaceae bacterium]|jgi:peptide/nickel transport system ATP-binding protein|nr:ABC transporter ATP-binding protein [Pseudobdellovibrionaceae bacterium]